MTRFLSMIPCRIEPPGVGDRDLLIECLERGVNLGDLRLYCLRCKEQPETTEILELLDRVNRLLGFHILRYEGVKVTRVGPMWYFDPIPPIA